MQGGISLTTLQEAGKAAAKPKVVAQKPNVVAQKPKGAAATAVAAAAAAAATKATSAAKAQVATALATAKEAAAVTASADSAIKGVGKSITAFFSSYGMYIAMAVGVICFILAVLVYLGYIKLSSTPPRTESISAALGAKVTPLTTTEGFEVPPQEISSDETTFINLQPLTIKDAGFVGPYTKGSYDVATATGNALKAGFRSLILQIDYMESTKPGFDKAYEPTLIVRDANGSLTSTNSGSITDVIQTLSNMAFRPEVPQHSQPLILYLHVNRAPSKLKDPKAYLRFLSKIAKALNPLAPMHLGMTPQGNFTRQKMADILLTTPLKSLEGQVVILCNADTSLFRSTSKSLDRYDPAQDLDFWVNMRVYLDSEYDSLGLTSLPASSDTASAVIVSLDRVLNLSSSATEAFAEKGKSRYVIGMGSRTTNPSQSDVDKGINTLGINMVPLDIFSDSQSNVLNLVKQYANMSYHPKPVALRNIS